MADNQKNGYSLYHVYVQEELDINIWNGSAIIKYNVAGNRLKTRLHIMHGHGIINLF